MSKKNEHQEKKKDDIPKKAASSKRKDLASEFLVRFKNILQIFLLFFERFIKLLVLLDGNTL